MLQKKVKLLLEQPQVCVFAEIVFGVRCTLNWNRLAYQLLFRKGAWARSPDLRDG